MRGMAGEILCTKCGTRNEAGASFCGGCGAFLEFYGKAIDAQVEPAIAGPESAAAEVAGVAAEAVGGGSAAGGGPIAAAGSVAEAPRATSAGSVTETPQVTAAPAVVPTAETVPIAPLPGLEETVKVDVPAEPVVEAPAPAIAIEAARAPLPPEAESKFAPAVPEPEVAPPLAPEGAVVAPAPALHEAEVAPAGPLEGESAAVATGTPSEAAAFDAVLSAEAPASESAVPTTPIAPAVEAVAEFEAPIAGPGATARAVEGVAPPETPTPGPEPEISLAPIAESEPELSPAPIAEPEPELSPAPIEPPMPKPRRGGPSRRFAVTAPTVESPAAQAIPASPSPVLPGPTSAAAAPASEAATEPAAGPPVAPAPTGPPPTLTAAAISTTPTAPPAVAPAQPLPRQPTAVEPPAVLPVAPPARPPVAAPEQPAARLPTEEIRRPVPRPTTAPAEVRVARPGDLICGNCGAPNDPSRHFCAACGRSLATSVAVPQRKEPWWRRLFRRRPKAPLEAGGRTAQMQAGERAAGRGVLGGLRNMVLTVLAVLVGFGVVGYFAVPSIRSAANDAIHQLTSAFATPIHVYPDKVTGKSVAGHGPQLAVDKTHNLFWAGPLGGAPPELDFTFNSPIDLTNLIVTPGAETDINGYARPKLIQITIGDAPPIQRTLNDAQLVDASSGTGKVLAYQVLDVSGSNVTDITLQVLSVYPGKRDAVAIGEVEFVAKP